MSAAFVTAPAGERTLTIGAYLAGALELTLVLAALAFGAHRVRALLLPGWSGAPARLAEAVLAVTGLIWVSEALGTFGGFEEGAVLGAVIVVGAAAGLVAGRLAAGRALPSTVPNMVSSDSSTSRLACSTRSGLAARCAAKTTACCSRSASLPLATGGGRIATRSTSCAVR